MRPERLVLVCGTGTGVGKTWVSSRLLLELRNRDLRVAARKPAQSFDVDIAGVHVGAATDAEVLGAASGEHAGTVCHSFRSYHRAMAPPMAAEALGLPPFTIAELIDEMVWPELQVDVGLVEMAGGVRSPQASDGDVVEFLRVLEPDMVIVVADAGLGTINGVRMSMEALATIVGEPAGGATVPTTTGTYITAGAGSTSIRSVVVLDRFDGKHEIHRRNRQWLTDRDGYETVALPGEEQILADLVAGQR